MKRGFGYVTTRAYQDGWSDGQVWDLDGFASWDEVERACEGWDSATISASEW